MMNEIAFRILEVAYKWKETRTDRWMLTSPVLVGKVFTNEQDVNNQFDWLVKVGFIQKTLKYHNYTQDIPWCISDAGEIEYKKEDTVKKRKEIIDIRDFWKARYWFLADPIKDAIKTIVIAAVTWFITWLSLGTKLQPQQSQAILTTQQKK